MKPPFKHDLYVIADDVPVLKKAVGDGAAIIQLRDKTGDRQRIMEKARQLLAYKKEKDFIFILNDDPALALEVGADGVHIGQDMSSVETRKMVGPDFIVGKTTHNLQQALQAVADGMDYISVGPVYATPTKPGRLAVGLAYVHEAAQKLDIPFVTIGGIDLSNIDKVLEAGAKTVAIVRAHTDAPALLAKIRARKE